MWRVYPITLGMSTYYGLVITLGIFGNIVILKAYNKVYQKQESHKLAKLMVTTLAISDLLAASTAIFKFFNLKNNVILCKIEGLFVAFLLQYSANTLPIVSIERYFAICRPFVVVTKKHVVFAIFVNIIITMAAISPEPLFKEVVAHNVCIIADSNLNKILMTVFVFFFHIFLLFCLIVPYGLIYRAVSRRLRAQRIHPVPAEAAMPSTSNKPHIPIRTGKGHSNERNHDKKLVNENICSPGQNKVIKTVSLSVVDYQRHPEMPTPNVAVAKKTNAVFLNEQAAPRTESSPQQELSSRVHRSRFISKNTAALQAKTAFIFFVITATFIISWVPFWIGSLSVLHDWGVSFPEVVHNSYYLNNVADPFIYGVLDKRVRNYIFSFKCCKH